MKRCNPEYVEFFQANAHLPRLKRPPDCPEVPLPSFTIARPGDLLAWAIHRLTGATSGNCACNERRAKMNDWGWTGCIARSPLIVTWLSEEAAKRGHPIGRSEAWSLVRAGWKEFTTHQATLKAAVE